MAFFSSDIHVHGEMFQTNNAVVTTINTVDVWEEIANFGTGITSLITYASNALTTLSSGDFDVHWTASSQSAGTNKVFEIAVSVNDVISTKSTQTRKFSTVDTGAMSGVATIHLDAGDVVKLEVRCVTDNTNTTIIDATVTLHRI